MRLVGNQLHMEEPEMIPFSRYVINCFHGTPAKPKLPGQNTEHCEQTVDAWLGRELLVKHGKTRSNMINMTINMINLDLNMFKMLKTS